MKQLFLIFNLWGMVFMLSSCSPTENKNKQVPFVKIDTVKTFATVCEVSYPGIIKPEDNLSLAFKVNGQLVDVLDTEGMFIKKGTLIASIDAHDYEVQFNAAEAAWQQAKKEFARITELYQAKTVSPNDYEKTEAVFKQVEAKYQAAKDALSYTELRAPFDGYIQNIYHHRKEIVQAGTPIVCFISANRFEVEINIPVQYYKKQMKHNGAKLLVDNQLIEIQMKSIGRQANVNQLYKMRFVVPQLNPSQYLTAGMSCNVILAYDEGQNNSTDIPVSAIYKMNGKSCVWKVESDMKVHQVPVSILKINHTCATVSGLKNNDRIVITGINELTEGQTVEKMPSVSDTNIGNML